MANYASFNGCCSFAIFNNVSACSCGLRLCFSVRCQVNTRGMWEEPLAFTRTSGTINLQTLFFKPLTLFCSTRKVTFESLLVARKGFERFHEAYIYYPSG